MLRSPAPSIQAGFSLVEIMVSVAIIAIGLLGLAGLQARAMVAEFESYQRSQALVLARDMVERARSLRAFRGTFKNVSNKSTGAGFIGTTGSGKFDTTGCSTSADPAIKAICTWEQLLLGNTETSGTNKLGAMVNARGCIYYDPATEISGIADSGEFTVAVVWQGSAETAAPIIPGKDTDANGSWDPLHCADGLYLDPTGTAKETLRRGIAISFRYAALS